MEETLKIRRKRVFRDGFLITLSILIAVLLNQSNYLENLIKYSYGASFILGAFLAGIFFASTFTVAISTSIFLLFAQTHNLFLIAVVGGLGALLGNSVIFKFLKDDLIADFEYLEKYFPKKTTKRIIHSRLILWFAPIFAALMLASPLPDEIGLLIFASIRLKYHHFVLVSFLLSTVGILVVSLFGKTI